MKKLLQISFALFACTQVFLPDKSDISSQNLRKANQVPEEVIIKPVSLSNFERQTILITGVSGLIGRLLFHHLSQKHSYKYRVIGLDQHLNLSIRYQNMCSSYASQESAKQIPLDRFYECDITDRERLYQIIAKEKVRIIIHLAAVLERTFDTERIKYVNIIGTRHVFEAPGVDRILYASSVMTIFGYLQYEPYLSIVNGRFDDRLMLKELRPLDSKIKTMMPAYGTPSVMAYSESKIIGEQMANMIRRYNHQKSVISIRFGMVNVEDDCGTSWYRTVWLSHHDACLFVERALEAPLNISDTYFAVSNNHRLWLDLNLAKQDFHYIPRDGAKNIYEY